MTAGGPAGSTNTIATYIYVSAFKSLDKGYASAIAVLLLVLLILYALVVIRIRRSLREGCLMIAGRSDFRAHPRRHRPLCARSPPMSSSRCCRSTGR